MQGRILRWAGGLMVIIGCTAGPTDQGVTTTGTGQSSTSVAEAGPTPVEDLPGRLVILDEAGDVVVMGPDGSDPESITDDAGESAIYSQPSFSPDASSIAWVELTAEGIGVGSSDSDGGNRFRVDTTAPPFYLFWSPDGSSIGVLHNALVGGLDLEVVDVEERTSSVVISGAPLYFSWSPDGSQIAAHVEGDVFSMLELDGTSADLGTTAAGYQAPQWTDAGIIHLGPNGIELLQPGGSSELVAEAVGPLAFVATPSGDKVALQTYPDDQSGLTAALTEIPAPPTGSVVVLDPTGGEVSTVIDSLAIGLFWSPDGESLLVLRPEDPVAGRVEVLVWRDGETRSLGRITPQPSFVRDVLQFFDQYAQSLRIWSPDSTAFALAGAIEGNPGIWVQDIAGGSAVEVAEGTWVTWSVEK